MKARRNRLMQTPRAADERRPPVNMKFPMDKWHPEITGDYRTSGMHCPWIVTKILLRGYFYAMRIAPLVEPGQKPFECSGVLLFTSQVDQQY